MENTTENTTTESNILDQRVVFNAELLAGVCPAISTEAQRYYLNGIYFEPAPNGGAIAVATNGHIMLVAHDPEGIAPKGGIILPLGALAAKLKSARLFTWVNDIARIAGKNMTEHLVKPIDGTFPDWRRICHPSTLEASEPVVAAFGHATVGGMCKAAKALGIPGYQVYAQISTGSAESYKNSIYEPHLVRFAARADIFGILMPMRVSIDGTLDWVYVPRGDELPHDTTADEPAQDTSAD
jgi:hypothetical protein